jgi:hypothetical protein
MWNSYSCFAFSGKIRKIQNHSKSFNLKFQKPIGNV